jgi:hypothetical protein
MEPERVEAAATLQALAAWTATLVARDALPPGGERLQLLERFPAKDAARVGRALMEAVEVDMRDRSGARFGTASCPWTGVSVFGALTLAADATGFDRDTIVRLAIGQQARVALTRVTPRQSLQRDAAACS